MLSQIEEMKLEGSTGNYVPTHVDLTHTLLEKKKVLWLSHRWNL